MKRLKTLPALNVFANHTLDKANAKQLFSILDHIKPEEKAEKRKRIREEVAKLAEQQEKSEKAKVAQNTEKQVSVSYRINNMTRLIERKKAKLVVIVRDVESLEMVDFIPYLCRKLQFPFCIVK